MDIEINNLSQQQKQLRLKIQSCKTEEKITALRKNRKQILHKISSKLQELRNKELDEQVASIDHTNDAAKMVKAAKLIQCKPYENIKIHNSEGKFVTEPNEIIKLTTEFFRNKFLDRNAQHIHPYKGEQRLLSNPITPLEIHKCFKKLNNNRAVGPDGIPGELYKYSTPILAHETVNCLSSLFETHENININEGEMIAPPKPGKSKGPVKS